MRRGKIEILKIEEGRPIPPHPFLLKSRIFNAHPYDIKSECEVRKYIPSCTFFIISFQHPGMIYVGPFFCYCWYLSLYKCLVVVKQLVCLKRYTRENCQKTKPHKQTRVYILIKQTKKITIKFGQK